MIGTTKSTISKYELGRREPSLGTIQRIADALRVDFLKLVEITGDDEEGIKKLLEDVDRYRQQGKKTVYLNGDIVVMDFTPAERIMNALDLLNPSGQQVAVERVEELTEIPKYQKDPPPEDSGNG